MDTRLARSRLLESDGVIKGGPADRPAFGRAIEIDDVSTESLVLPLAREEVERRSVGDRVKLLLQSGVVVVCGCCETLCIVSRTALTSFANQRSDSD